MPEFLPGSMFSSLKQVYWAKDRAARKGEEARELIGNGSRPSGRAMETGFFRKERPVDAQDQDLDGVSGLDAVCLLSDRSHALDSRPALCMRRRRTKPVKRIALRL